MTQPTHLLAHSPVPDTNSCALTNTNSPTNVRYCDVKLSHAARVESLLAMLTLEEKAGLVSPDPGLGNLCFAHIHAIPRVGLPEYVSAFLVAHTSLLMVMYLYCTSPT
jgi:hypothetical protein